MKVGDYHPRPKLCSSAQANWDALDRLLRLAITFSFSSIASGIHVETHRIAGFG
jgi:hypothetical protein